MRAVINNESVSIIDGTLDWTQNEPGQFDITIAAIDMSITPEVGSTISIYSKENLLMSGFVFDIPTPEYNQNGITTWSLSGLDNLGLLSVARPKSEAHYQDTSVTNIIQTLLASSDWYLSDTATMEDPSVKTTVDVRSKESLWAQIRTVIDNVPNLFIRYGGFNSVLGKHALQLGSFGTPQPHIGAVVDYTAQFPVYRPYKIVEAYGSVSGGVIVSLKHALDNPETTAHSDYVNYPIVQDGDVYYVDDLTKESGFEIRKEFGAVKTKNSGVSSTIQRREAGFALWQKTVRFCQENAEYKSGKLTAYLSDIPSVSNTYWVRQKTDDYKFDPMWQITRYRNTFSLEGWLRLTSASINLKQNPTEEGLLYTLTLSDRPYNENDADSDVNLYARLENHTKEDLDTLTVELLEEEKVSVTYGPSDLADCDSLTGKRYTAVSEDKPGGTSTVYYTYTTDPITNVTVEVTQEPTTSLDLEACVKYNGSWPPPVDITLNVYYQYV